MGRYFRGRWCKKYKGPYVISDKLDGTSGLLVYDNGKLSIFTRGNGYIGQNISYLQKLMTFPNPKKLKKFIIRGEFIISKISKSIKSEKSVKSIKSVKSLKSANPVTSIKSWKSGISAISGISEIVE